MPMEGIHWLLTPRGFRNTRAPPLHVHYVVARGRQPIVIIMNRSSDVECPTCHFHYPKYMVSPTTQVFELFPFQHGLPTYLDQSTYRRLFDSKSNTQRQRQTRIDIGDQDHEKATTIELSCVIFFFFGKSSNAIQLSSVLSISIQIFHLHFG